MKFLLLLLLFLSAHSVLAQNLWERNEKMNCVETDTNVDEVKAKLHKQHGKDCDYLRDATRVVLGSFFKCPDNKTYPYFRSKENCEMFFAEGKKDLVKFAPSSAKDPKKWVANFGTCMKTASQQQVNTMGLRTLTIFCHCVAAKTTDKINDHIVKECSDKL
jgi:hypothetical protein